MSTYRLKRFRYTASLSFQKDGLDGTAGLVGTWATTSVGNGLSGFGSPAREGSLLYVKALAANRISFPWFDRRTG
jgi:hypothetical protein